MGKTGQGCQQTKIKTQRTFSAFLALRSLSFCLFLSSLSKINKDHQSGYAGVHRYVYTGDARLGDHLAGQLVFEQRRLSLSSFGHDRQRKMKAAAVGGRKLEKCRSSSDRRER